MPRQVDVKGGVGVIDYHIGRIWVEMAGNAKKQGNTSLERKARPRGVIFLKEARRKGLTTRPKRT